MADDQKIFLLRYVGRRFEGTRLPLDVLPDLSAFRDLLVSYAKDRWRTTHALRRRLPKGFDKSISFDLVALDDGSAMPKLGWNRDNAQAYLPTIADELELLVAYSYEKIIHLIDGAGTKQFQENLSSERIRALNKFGSALRGGERIEFAGTSGGDGKVVFLDTMRRKTLLKRATDIYQIRYEGVGRLLGSHIDGYIDVDTAEYGNLRIYVAPDRIVNEFDGNITADLQFALQIELDNNDAYKSIIEVFEIELFDSEVVDSLTRCRQRLLELGDLRQGWLDGVGSAISRQSIVAVESLLVKRSLLAGICRIYPTVAGGVLIEFVKGGWDFSVEIDPIGSVEMYGVQIDGAEEMEPQSFADMDEDFLITFDARVGR